MSIKKGDTVQIEYTGKLNDGTVFDSTTHEDHSHPLEFQVGEKQVLPTFEEEVVGMEEGDEKSFTIEPEDAYGEYNPQLTKEIPRDALGEQKVQPGMTLAMGLPNGKRALATVKEVGDEKLTIDMNHPLAGKTLNFEIKVVKINP